MTPNNEIAAIKEALTNASGNGYPQEPQDDVTLATDLWMDATCEHIPYEQRLKIVQELRASGWLTGM